MRNSVYPKFTYLQAQLLWKVISSGQIFLNDYSDDTQHKIALSLVNRSILEIDCDDIGFLVRLHPSTLSVCRPWSVGLGTILPSNNTRPIRFDMAYGHAFIVIKSREANFAEVAIMQHLETKRLFFPMVARFCRNQVVDHTWEEMENVRHVKSTIIRGMAYAMLGNYYTFEHMAQTWSYLFLD